MKIQRALLSVSDKSGLAELAKALVARGVELVSTGGTAKFLAEQQLPVTAISDFTGAPEILGGRVKTLHPKVFGGILHDRSKSDHLRDCEANNIGPIDLVVVNLYPFEQTVAREGVTLAEAIEQIDVGGPSMLRAAAKNHRDVVVLCSPDLYEPFLQEFEAGDITEEFRKRAAIEVFRRTASYDKAITEFLTRDVKAAGSSLAPRIDLRLDQLQSLRYGENPQQSAGFYSVAFNGVSGSSEPFQQLQGKELSYNNLLDLDAAWKLAFAFDEPSCAIIKHTNPCGVASGTSAAEALRTALEADPVSAFGGIIASNQPFDGAAAEVIGSLFLEVIVAPDFTPEAVELLAKKKNLRLVKASNLMQELELKTAAGGVLVQTRDRFNDHADWRVVSKRQPTAEESAALHFAWIVCAHVKSNGIVITRGKQSIGIGAGQMSRVDSAKLAIMKAIHPTAGCVGASDAFFPFRDGLDILADAGITAVVQPGGSVRDEEVIAAADERNMAMIFTGQRHFRH
jgi:phosphoribosylaminoimidazolecarboxamide formyltransferase/IMP cyclohydrolase